MLPMRMAHLPEAVWGCRDWNASLTRSPVLA
jgi:hypothetical protein